MIRWLAALIIAGTVGVAYAGVSAQVLVYERQESGTEAYRSRLIATKEHLRVDYGSAGDDFILFDRKTQTIHSVVHADKSIIVIKKRPLRGESPVVLDLHEEVVSMGADVPAVANRKPEQHRLYSGKRLCLSVVAVPGLLPDVLAARREMAQVLASEHAATLPSVPADQQDPCDMAVNIFRADWVTGFGLPIREEDFTGTRQTLLDLQETFDAAPALFRLPEGYRTYNISELK
jgi:hypothetical protein